MKKASRQRIAKAFVGLLDEYKPADLIAVVARELVRTGRISELDLMARDINRELLGQKHHLEMTLTTAHELAPKTVSAIEDSLMKSHGALTVHSRVSRDPKILGRYVAETPDELIDISLKHKLEQLEV